MLKMQMLVYLLVCTVSLENNCKNYTQRTSACPKNKAEWDKRAKEFPCVYAGRGYTCMILRDSQSVEPDYLVETCINTAYKIADGFPGCPFIIDCDEDGPLIGTEFSLMPCNTTLPGCPPKYHGGYTLNELYKYQACLLFNETHNRHPSLEVTTSLGTKDTSYAVDLRLIVVIVLVSLAVALISSGIIIILCRRRHQRQSGNSQFSCCISDEGHSQHEGEGIPLFNVRDNSNEEKIKRLQNALLKINYDETQRVLLAPLESSTIPIDMIYAPVLIRKDLEETLQRQHLGEDTNPELANMQVNGPDDVFVKNGRPTRFVMMQGEAGRGKSVYCLQLMKYWCNAKKAGALSDWERCLEGFPFIFLVTLRDFQTQTSLVDMICDDVRLKSNENHTEAITFVLENDDYQCLVIADGLDEWKNSDLCIPSVEKISHTTFFFTMRPWRFDGLTSLIRETDRVIEIKGLDENGLDIIIKKLLISHFKVTETSPEYNTYYQTIKTKVRETQLKSLMQVPLFAVVVIMLLFRNENGQLEQSETLRRTLTSLFTALLRMLIERAFRKRQIDKNIFKNEISKEPKCDINIPQILQDDMLSEFIGVLIDLGEIAYEDLKSQETRLVFEKAKLVQRLGESSLNFALNVGILAHLEAKGPSYAQHVTVSFFHKTVQEFLTAILVASKKEVYESFLKHLSSIKIIIEFENVNMFVSGLSPPLGETLCQHIVKVINANPDICRYRESFHHKIRNKVGLLYKMQLGCLRELLQPGEGISNTTQLRDYNISGVYVHDKSDIDTVRMTADVLRHHNTNIVSLHIRRVANDIQDGIDDTVIHDFLQQTTTLTSLYISGRSIKTSRTLRTINTVTSLKALVLAGLSITPSLLHDIQTSLLNNRNIKRLGLGYIKCVGNGEERHDSEQVRTTSFCGLLQNLRSCKHLSWLDFSYMSNKESREMFAKVLPCLRNLKSIEYYGSTCSEIEVEDADYDYKIVHIVSQWKNLHVLGLANICLGDRSLELPADIEHLEKVWLDSVKMSAGGWGKFITSLKNIKHQFDVELLDTNISANDATMILSSPDFIVTHHDEGKSELSFTRKFPPTPQT